MEAGSSASSSLESSRRTRSETGQHSPSGTETGTPGSAATSSSNSSRDSRRLVPKEGTKSPVWRYFGLKVGEDGRPIDNGQVYCRMCPMSVWARSGNTSNLFSHLKNNHKTTFALVKAAKSNEGKSSHLSDEQPTIVSALEGAQPYTHSSKKWKELTDSVTRFIVKDCLPIHSVEKEGFKAMIHKFDSRYDLPSSTYFSRTAIPKLYSATKDKVAKQLSNVEYFSSTTDMWSSIGSKPYISFTVHFIDEGWNISSLALSVHFLPEDHTAAIIGEALKETLAEWHLDSKVQVALTTDSGANVVAAANLLDWVRISCFGHNLHLAITKALNDDRRCSRALGVARKIVSAFSLSWKRKRELSKAQVNLNLAQHSLVTVSILPWWYCMH